MRRQRHEAGIEHRILATLAIHAEHRTLQGRVWKLPAENETRMYIQKALGPCANKVHMCSQANRRLSSLRLECKRVRGYWIDAGDTWGDKSSRVITDIGATSQAKSRQ